MTDHDWNAVFVACGEVLEAIAPQLTVAQQATTVPATPEWTVTEVYAHLAGVGTSFLTGSMEGAPGPAWTAQHVSDRRGQSLVDLVAEIRACEGPLAEVIPQMRTPLMVWDRSVHVTDVCEALGMPVAPEPLWAPVGARIAHLRLREQPVTVHSGDHTFGAGGPEVTIDPYELYRILWSRRSRAQVRAAFGDSLTAEQLDGIPNFGPRDDDQPQPA